MGAMVNVNTLGYLERKVSAYQGNRKLFAGNVHIEITSWVHRVRFEAPFRERCFT